ncbi:MAG: hypothetical protein AB7S83_01305 [Candidatus Methanomethylophilaceae archaeon]
MVDAVKKPGTEKTGSTNKGPSSNVKKNSKRFKPKTKVTTKRQSMLNMHKMSPFKYDMNEILIASSMDPDKASSFLASVIAKASRTSTKEAKDFVRTFLDSGELTKEEFDRISRLLDKYGKYR